MIKIEKFNYLTICIFLLIIPFVFADVSESDNLRVDYVILPVVDSNNSLLIINPVSTSEYKGWLYIEPKYSSGGLLSTITSLFSSNKKMGKVNQFPWLIIIIIMFLLYLYYRSKKRETLIRQNRKI